MVDKKTRLDIKYVHEEKLLQQIYIKKKYMKRIKQTAEFLNFDDSKYETFKKVCSLVK